LPFEVMSRELYNAEHENNPVSLLLWAGLVQLGREELEVI